MANENKLIWIGILGTLLILLSASEPATDVAVKNDTGETSDYHWLKALKDLPWGTILELINKSASLLISLFSKGTPPAPQNSPVYNGPVHQNGPVYYGPIYYYGPVYYTPVFNGPISLYGLNDHPEIRPTKTHSTTKSFPEPATVTKAKAVSPAPTSLVNSLETTTIAPRVTKRGDFN